MLISGWRPVALCGKLLPRRGVGLRPCRDRCEPEASDLNYFNAKKLTTSQCVRPFSSGLNDDFKAKRSSLRTWCFRSRWRRSRTQRLRAAYATARPFGGRTDGGSAPLWCAIKRDSRSILYAKLVRAWPSVYLRSATYRCGTGHTSTELKTAKLKLCFPVITSSTISTRCGERSSKRLLHIYFFCLFSKPFFRDIFFSGVV
jgi:hypothetical protein